MCDTGRLYAPVAGCAQPTAGRRRRFTRPLREKASPTDSARAVGLGADEVSGAAGGGGVAAGAGGNPAVRQHLPRRIEALPAPVAELRVITRAILAHQRGAD